MSIESKFIVSGILLILSIITGFWLSKLGRPLNTFVFTVHKLSALAILILISTALYSIRTQITVHSTLTVLASVFMVSLVVLFVTGGFLSFEWEFSGTLKMIHRKFPWPAVICGAAFFFIFSRNQ